MQVEQIVQMESDKLELSGLFDERSQEPVKGLLLYLYTAVDIWMLLSPDDRRSVRGFNEFFEKERVVKLFLKELKSKKNKEKTAPAPHRKEKNIKEKSQKITKKGLRGHDSVLKEKQNEFWRTLLPFMEKYGESMLERFQAYWAAPVNGTLTLLWETKKTWSVSYRLKSWSKSPIEQNAQNAEIRLERVKGKKAAAGRVLGGSSAEEQAIAAKRAEDNEKLEREIAARKAGAASMEEVAGADPNRLSTIQNLLARKFESPVKKH